MTFFIASLVFILDRLTKAAVMGNMSVGQSIKILPNIFQLTFVLNDGTAFGLLKGANAAFAFFSAIMIILISGYALIRRRPGIIVSLALGLILGGAAGNLFDRLKFGHIIDFLDFRVWPVFNVADAGITVGMILLAIRILL